MARFPVSNQSKKSFPKPWISKPPQLVGGFNDFLKIFHLNPSYSMLFPHIWLYLAQPSPPPTILPSHPQPYLNRLNRFIQATYGVKMAEKVRELLLRLAKARSCFEALRPQLEPLVRQLDHRAAASEAERHRQRQAEEEAKEREAQEAARSWKKNDENWINSNEHSNEHHGIRMDLSCSFDLDVFFHVFLQLFLDGDFA